MDAPATSLQLHELGNHVVCTGGSGAIVASPSTYRFIMQKARLLELRLRAWSGDDMS